MFNYAVSKLLTGPSRTGKFGQVDFAFLSTTQEESGVTLTVLTAVDVRTQMAMAVVVPSKQVTPYAITELKRFIYETGRTHAILQCDRESTVMNLLQEVAKDIGGLTVRYIPTASSQSNGSLE